MNDIEHEGAYPGIARAFLGDAEFQRQQRVTRRRIREEAVGRMIALTLTMVISICIIILTIAFTIHLLKGWF